VQVVVHAVAGSIPSLTPRQFVCRCPRWLPDTAKLESERKQRFVGTIGAIRAHLTAESRGLCLSAGRGVSSVSPITGECRRPRFSGAFALLGGADAAERSGRRSEGIRGFARRVRGSGPRKAVCRLMGRVVVRAATCARREGRASSCGAAEEPTLKADDANPDLKEESLA
jgi:hypothetical protein